MRSGSKSAVLATIGGILLLAVLWFWLRADTPTTLDTTVAGGQPVADEVLAVADEATGQDEEMPAVAEGTTTDSRPGSNEPSPGPGALSPSPAEAEPELLSPEQEVVLRDVESSISAALSGDQNEALELASFLNQCQFSFRDRNRVEQSITRAERSFAEGKPLTQFRPSSPAQQFDNLADFESSQWDTFFRCEAARRLVNDDFWRNLEAQADAGNPVARYLFATLIRESPATIIAFENWDEELELREQSRDYTWRNLEDREPLGLLALAQQEGFGFGLRGNSISNGSVLVLAAVKCGLSTPDLLQAVDQILQMAERLETTQPGALERLNNASDEARRMFCK